ncbi:OPT superfamily oligopeptide transporter [Xylona heveae TC161]|uniref:OPT superfamily oligopeptide transporter n=1 Tax=Xylona heveae (strain CBS 132557 / TC161) TaxID=1328760 RepID=A0A165AGP9_XYLHT|nr:OPT superfamily oligopeptide transporter [Xylona heveae TC161]KZF20443.1 OPT superfamily oligopeptide transporter [Xylona heveae TC161]
MQSRGIGPTVVSGFNVIEDLPNGERVVRRASVDPNGISEKIGDIKDGSAVSITEEEIEAPDPFKPFPHDPGVPEETNILRVRSIFIGLVCGALVNASNVYLGLKTGWTFSANLFGAILGFAVIKFCSNTFAKNFPILGGDFGPKENNIIQTSATAAGGLSSIFISALPALYQLNLMSDDPKKDYWRIVSFTTVCAYFGFFFATPLRKFFIIYLARELRLVFPTGTATAMTIRSMHAAIGGAAIAKAKTKAMGIAFAGACTLRVVSQYCIGILWDWHIFTWFYIWGHYKNLAINVENWGWYVEWTPAFIGSGMIVGLNPSWSFFFGSVVAWGIIGPALVHNGAAYGVQALGPDGPEKWQDYITFASLHLKDAKNNPSPRYWLLWPGVLTMIVVSFTELFCQYKVLYYTGISLWRAVAMSLNATFQAMKKDVPWIRKQASIEEKHTVQDFATEDELVKWWMWAPGLLVVIICTCVVLGLQYNMPVGMSLLAVFLGFIFSFLAIQCTGVTDITPLTAASKASQLVLGGATRGEHWSIKRALTLNLIGGTIASGSANQSSDLTTDFRVGFLLRTPPKQQWIAQGIGSVVAIFLAPGMFVLFTKAYPCIIDLEADTCAFAAPSVSAWRAVAQAVTDPVFPVPTSSGIFSVIFAAFGALLVIFRTFYLTGSREKYRVWVPNMMAVALAFVLPQTQYGTAMAIGSTASYIWAKKSPVKFDIYCYAVAAGLIAGEGIGGVINAIFQVAGISGDKYGTNIACPGDSC